MWERVAGVLVTGLLVAASVCAAEVVVRVQPTPGGPQIHVNGQPVVPRWFFGSMRGGTIAAGAEWSQQSFDFTTAADVSGRGTLHFRFGHVAGEVWLADVRVFDAQTGRDVLPPGSFATGEAFEENWNTWPLGEANTVGAVEVVDGGLHVTIADPPGGNWPDFHLHSDTALSFAAGHTYTCAFRVRATPDRAVTPAVYHVLGGVWSHIGGPPGPFLHQVALARDAGVSFVSFSAPNCWTAPEEPTDFRSLDELCESIVAVNPNVLLVPRVGANAPPWWLERHPEARMVYEGDAAGRYASVSHRQYRADAAAHLEKLCRHLTERFPDNFAGIHPCGQNTGEWFYEDSWKRPLSGYDPATLAAWREWLAVRGVAGAASAEVPDAESRHAAPHGLLRDPGRELMLIEFNRFQQREMAEMVMALAAAARRGTDGKKLVVFFYGYHYEFGAMPNGAPVAGHYALGRVLQATDIDILCSPISYTDRQWPGTAPCMSPAESIRDAGIMWLNEDDTRTYLSGETRYGGVADLQQTRDVMLRNTAQAALRGFATWWMDLPAQGWFDDPAIWEELTRLAPVDRALLERAAPFTPEIAAIIGEESMCHLAGGANAISRPLIYDARAALGRSGAPYGQFMLAQAIAGEVPARLQIYLAAW
ncbi:MAG TPA: beta-galactosidase, partial [Armatimonadota bacterium]|nr:beta-galactosidase [Armatimonadota bacterium]